MEPQRTQAHSPQARQVIIVNWIRQHYTTPEAQTWNASETIGGHAVKWAALLCSAQEVTSGSSGFRPDAPSAMEQRVSDGAPAEGESQPDTGSALPAATKASDAGDAARTKCGGNGNLNPGQRPLLRLRAIGCAYFLGKHHTFSSQPWQGWVVGGAVAVGRFSLTLTSVVLASPSSQHPRHPPPRLLLPHLLVLNHRR